MEREKEWIERAGEEVRWKRAFLLPSMKEREGCRGKGRKAKGKEGGKGRKERKDIMGRKS